MFRPQLLAAAVVLGLVMLPVAVWLDLRNLSDQALHAQASSLSSIISDIRGYYARNVVGPAAALSVSELKEIVLPAGDLEPYDHNLDGTAMAVTVPYEAMLHWLEDDDGVQKGQIKEVSLVHLPVYQFKYTFGDRRFTAMVDAASSKVFANIYPSKWETPYFAIGAAAFAAYCCAALIPLGGFLTYEGTGLLVGILAYIVIAIIVAIPIFIAASVISAKV
jgi:hypothetical protein